MSPRPSLFGNGKAVDMPGQSDHSMSTAIQDINNGPGTISKAMEDSQLGRLPAEIRNMIYTMVLRKHHGISREEEKWLDSRGGSSISTAMNIMATCKQIRAETRLIFLTVNDITISSAAVRRNYKTGWYWQTWQQTIARLHSIPSMLLSPKTRVIFVTKPDADLLGVVPHLKKLPQIQHLRLYLRITLATHRWGSEPDEYSDRSGHNDIETKPICVRDAPASMNTCAQVKLIISIDDYTAARASVEDLYRKKVALIEAHRHHRFCPIRMELGNLLTSASVARQKLLELVELAWSENHV